MSAAGVEEKEIAMDAGRVCDAIAKIGYMPVPALMDIIDNSVAADATWVRVSVSWNSEELSFRNKNNVLSYQIADNGHGMTSEAIERALQLGSDVLYPNNSLSKYGMGLKSAGLSLGTKIQVFSKKDGVWSAATLDSARIKDTKKWVIVFNELSEDEKKSLDSEIGQTDSGTIVRIDGCEFISQDSAKKTIAGLEKRLGVVYEQFLRRPKRPLKISIAATEMEERLVSPKDLLFLDIADTSGFDPDKYDCLTPVKVVDEEVAITENPEDPKAQIEVVIFPQHQMSNYVDFTKEQREQVKSYEINRENKGFFVYRNERLIRWGDSLDGIVDRDILGFRAKLRLFTAHDDALHVDVSKQHMTIPEDILEDIERIVRNAKKASKEAFEKCSEMQRNTNEEGDTFNSRNDDLTEEDPYQPDSKDAKEEAKKRKKRIRTETKKTLDGTDEGEEGDGEVESAQDVFEKVRYSHAVSADLLWESHEDIEGGTFIRVNRNHAFYNDILSQLESGSPERQAIEAILWTAGVAENTTLEHEREDFDLLKKVIDGFKRRLSFNLGKWVHINQDLFR